MTETIHALLGGFAVALTPVNLLWALAGVTLASLSSPHPGEGRGPIGDRALAEDGAQLHQPTQLDPGLRRGGVLA